MNNKVLVCGRSVSRTEFYSYFMEKTCKPLDLGIYTDFTQKMLLFVKPVDKWRTKIVLDKQNH